MKKIVYFHGLETPQGGKKVEYLTQNHVVYAPEVFYRDTDSFMKELERVKEIQPDYIIGSSFGGYFAYLMGTHIKTKVILFNPALHSRTYEPEISLGFRTPTGICVLGEEDTVVDPKLTKRMIDGNSIVNNNIKIWMAEGEGHRTPFNLFKFIVEDNVK